jgi:hypothetical protein
MIIDQSGIFCGTSSRRMFDYLTLCKVDVLIRNMEQSMPSRRVDQPSKVGQAGTISRPVNPVRSITRIKVDYTLKTGNRDQTLSIKREMAKQSGLYVESLSEVGTAILQQDSRDLEYLPLYRVVSSADNFANKERKEWMFCLVLNKQDTWVNAFADLSVKSRLQVDYLMLVNYGQIRYISIPKK